MDLWLAYLIGTLSVPALTLALRLAAQVQPLYRTWRHRIRRLRRQRALSRPRLVHGSSDLLLWPPKKGAPRT